MGTVETGLRLVSKYFQIGFVRMPMSNFLASVERHGRNRLHQELYDANLVALLKNSAKMHSSSFITVWNSIPCLGFTAVLKYWPFY